MDRTRGRDWGAVEGIVARTHRFVPASQAASAALQKIERLRSWRPNHGLPTGLSLLDQETGGLQPGSLTVLAGRPATGKTTLALQIARETLFRREEPLGVALFSLAEAREAIFTRLLAQEAGVQLHPLRTGFSQRTEWSSVESAGQRLSKAPLHIDDDPCLTAKATVERTRVLAAELKSRGKALGLVVIDYLQRVYGPGGRIDKQPREIEKVGRALRRLTQDTGVAILVLAQTDFSEAGCQEPPNLVDLGAVLPLERQADLVLLVGRKHGHEASIIVAKSLGRTGTVPVRFLAERPIFVDGPEDPMEFGENP